MHEYDAVMVKTTKYMSEASVLCSRDHYCELLRNGAFLHITIYASLCNCHCTCTLIFFFQQQLENSAESAPKEGNNKSSTPNEHETSSNGVRELSNHRQEDHEDEPRSKLDTEGQNVENSSSQSRVGENLEQLQDGEVDEHKLHDNYRYGFSFHRPELASFPGLPQLFFDCMKKSGFPGLHTASNNSWG